MPNSPLTPSQQRRLLDACARHLLTSIGLRSLAASDRTTSAFTGQPPHADGAYHQGTTWAWLIGPFVQAHLRVYQDPSPGRAFLEPFRHHLSDAGLAASAKSPTATPFTPRGSWQAERGRSAASVEMPEG
ncbi:amylo-alpha-1,6-glucosidase [Candidatus Amarolinea dominans]|uniref:amylo-alpha-1,6-glucosidase n=1 Tax=Candidatus Amarolinea dominans TaxID=3140696 RepID=UPI0031CCCD42